MYAIGDPGRAAREVSDGVPPRPAGDSDVELSSAALPGMVVRAASCRGLAHRARDKPRQDAFALAATEDPPGRLVAVVCDGVGEFDRSGEAARLVSHGLAGMAAGGTAWPEAFGQINEELLKQADRMATTVIAVVVRREGAEWAGEAAWVGDSVLWHLAAGRWQLVTGTDGSDEDGYYSTGVRPLPSADSTFGWREFRLSGGMLAVMTDGMSNPLRWSDQVKESLAAWWRQPPDPFTFAAQVGFARRSHMDDRTVVGVWPGPGGSADDEPDDGNGSGAGENPDGQEG
jgi:Protein phosphatase 2C